MSAASKPEWAEAVIRVGDGRGFIVAAGDERLIITAGHCLPGLPPYHGASCLYERTFDALLGPIGEEPKVSAECLFADPIADLAILGMPDSQNLAYEALVEDRATLSIISLPTPAKWPIPDLQRRGWLLSLDGEWFSCDVQQIGRALWIENAAQPIVGGMSGSPIIAEDGRAIGVACMSSSSDNNRGGGPNPYLADVLPAWAFWRMVAARRH
jgi:Trypsin-like peptidase domain